MALYGLKKSPQWWFETVKPLLEELGFISLSTDICLFRHKEDPILIILYVDDFQIAAKTKALIDRTKEAIKKVYDIKELGETKRFLGLNITRNRKARATDACSLSVCYVE
jgi:hypothetical protein